MSNLSKVQLKMGHLLHTGTISVVSIWLETLAVYQKVAHSIPRHERTYNNSSSSTRVVIQYWVGCRCNGMTNRLHGERFMIIHQIWSNILFSSLQITCYNMLLSFLYVCTLPVCLLWSYNTPPLGSKTQRRTPSEFARHCCPLLDCIWHCWHTGLIQVYQTLS